MKVPFIGELLAFLKFAIGVNVVGLVVKIIVDMHGAGNFSSLLLYLKKVGVVKMKLLHMIPFEDEHTTVLGLTRYGKTYAIMHSLKHINEGVLFFNMQHEKTPLNFIKASEKNTFSQIKGLLKDKKKINYLPSDDLEGSSKELAALINELYKSGGLDVRFVIDEVHLFSLTKNKEGLKGCIRLATTGLRHGYKAVFISQRPAKVENTLYTQSTKHVLFALGKLDESYLKHNGFPVEEIMDKTKNEKYNFVLFDQKDVKGAFRIGE